MVAFFCGCVFVRVFCSFKDKLKSCYLLNLKSLTSPRIKIDRWINKIDG